MESQSSKSVTVLGMHRSGTSALTRLLIGNGFFAGAEADLLEGNFSNKYGHFEHRSINELNDRLLASLGGSWYSPPPFDAVEVAIGDLCERATQPLRTLVEGLSEQGRPVLKDPRASLLLPVWACVLPSTAFAVCVRNPLNVAQSLQARNDTPIPVGLAMWEVYNAALLRWAPLNQTLFINSDALVDLAYRCRVVRKLQEACGAPPQSWQESYDVEAFHTSRAGAWRRAVSAQQAQLYDAILRKGGPDSNVRLEVDHARSILEGYIPDVNIWEQRLRQRNDGNRGGAMKEETTVTYSADSRWAPVTRREELLTIGVDPTCQIGLEIGAANNPIIPRSVGTCRYVDYLATDDLRTRLAGYAYVDQIVDVDFVWSGSGSLVEKVGDDRFDYALASHVLEHVPNPIGWLAGIFDALNPGAHLNLALPDRRFTFDFSCPLSSLGELVEAYLLQYDRPSVRQVFDSCFYGKAIDPGERWTREFDPNTVGAYSGDIAPALALAQAKRAVEGEYFDSHCWVFTPESFLDLLEGLCTLELMPFELVDYHPTIAGEFEFFVSLKKPINQTDTKTLLDAQVARLAFFRSAIDQASRRAALLLES